MTHYGRASQRRFQFRVNVVVDKSPASVSRVVLGLLAEKYQLSIGWLANKRLLPHAPYETETNQLQLLFLK